MEWIRNKETLVGELLSFAHLERVPHSITNGDGSLCDIKYLGGLRVGIRFSSCRDRNLFMKSWTEWFAWVDSGDIADIPFDRIAWLKIFGLPLDLWNEDNLTKIGESFGRVIVPYSLDQSAVDFSFARMGIISNSKSPIFSEALVKINGQISKVGVVEVDVDWSPFKKSRLHLDEEKSSDDDDDMSGSEFSNDEDGISETLAMDMTSESPEEGEIIQDDDTEIVADSCAPEVNVAVVDSDDVQATVAIPGQNVDLNSHDLRINDNGGLQKAHGDSTAHVDMNRDFSLDKGYGDQEINLASINMMSPVGEDVNAQSPEAQFGPSPFGPLENLAKSGCFGPFPANNSLGPVGNSPLIDGLNFSIGGSMGKRRRIIHSEKISPINFEDPPFETQLVSHSPSPTLDLNENPIPSTIPLPDSDSDSLSSSSEVRKTAMVGQILGFDIDEDNPILKEVMENSGENILPK
ncbi:hypothetical protein L1887_20488 [Cichorium endivia]|nr:hypothetical protein L1887_20488 [Cichorium endivia]